MPRNEISSQDAATLDKLAKEIDRNIISLEKQFKNDISKKTIRIEAKLSILNELKKNLQRGRAKK